MEVFPQSKICASGQIVWKKCKTVWRPTLSVPSHAIEL